MDSKFKEYFNIAEAISKLLYPFAEVVIHDLNKQQIKAIFNPISKREVGDSSYMDDIDLDVYDELPKVIGPYEKLNYDGRKIKSIITVIESDEGDVIGTLCMNLDISVFDKYQGLINIFLKNNDYKMSEQKQSLFKDTLYEKINKFVQKYCIEKILCVDNLTRSQKKNLILELKNQGALDGKNASQYVARVLSVSRATVYNYLK
ncbi:hypothetical protein CDV26_09950 [Francisella halioticida]|uniref:DNA-binding protein n=1 Tax=Francisella halioticida TaxID=549298 RepID=A0ABN5AY74_9GAMM|nr:PAS domain-containing protein [Francisella halioticida]ASG68670.1 hypothetical protein CDV26_09950 [Francisella halioticida]